MNLPLSPVYSLDVPCSSVVGSRDIRNTAVVSGEMIIGQGDIKMFQDNFLSFG